ncbi:MAG: hypothetical protein J0M13_06035 [Candidatus Accumulibacter sp.]|jgi:hypothetical protein|nr:hypothetical protein [Candidatus Accumulibacter necessarius]
MPELLPPLFPTPLKETPVDPLCRMRPSRRTRRRIHRGDHDTKEPEVLAAQGIAPAVPKLTLRSGDGKLVKISQTLLDEGPAGLWTANVAQ